MLPIWHFETRGDKCSWKARPLSRQTVKEPRWGPMRLTHHVSYGVCVGGHPSFLADHGTACSGLGQALPST